VEEWLLVLLVLLVLLIRGRRGLIWSERYALG
jgi:hypothetical protein